MPYMEVDTRAVAFVAPPTELFCSICGAPGAIENFSLEREITGPTCEAHKPEGYVLRRFSFQTLVVLEWLRSLPSEERTEEIRMLRGLYHQAHGQAEEGEV